jgi:signal transduction histidine kinase
MSGLPMNFPKRTAFCGAVNDSARVYLLTSLGWELRNSLPQKTIDYGKEAIYFASRYNLTNELLKAHSFTGVGYRNIGNYNAALDYFSANLKLANELGISDQSGYALVSIGGVFIDYGYFEGAEEQLGKALRIGKEINNNSILAYSYLHLGRLSLLRNEFDKALKYFNNSLSLRKDDVQGQSICYRFIADVYLRRGQHNLALDNYFRSLSYAPENNFYNQTMALNGIAKIYIQLKNYEEALNYAKSSLEAAKKFTSSPRLKEAYQSMAEALIGIGDIEQALYFQNQVIAQNDSIIQNLMTQKIKTLEYEEEKKKDMEMINLLNKEKELKNLQIKTQKVLIYASFLGLVFISVLLILAFFANKNNKQARLIISKNNQELTELNATKDKFFSIIAHDIKSPLSTIIGFCDFIELEGDNLPREKLRLYISLLGKNAKRTNDLLENLLEWSKLQRGIIKPRFEKVSMSTLINDVIMLYKDRADDKNILLQYNESREIFLELDTEMTKMILRNLISNAVKFTKTGGKVSVEIIEEKSNIAISVEDTGVGISTGRLSDLFRIEKNISTPGTSEEKGSGLGLILCKELAEKQGARILVDSIQGKGSNFSLQFPARNIV